MNPRPILAVLMVSVIVTCPVNALIALITACLRITAMDGNRFLVFKFRSPHQLLPSLLPRSSSLIEYALRDFVEAFYEVDHHMYIWTVAEIDKLDNEVLVSFMQAISSFHIKYFCWPKTPGEFWLKNSSVLYLIPPPRETK